MKAEREWFDPAKRSILAKTSPDSVIDVFSFILLIYHSRRIHARVRRIKLPHRPPGLSVPDFYAAVFRRPRFDAEPLRPAAAPSLHAPAALVPGRACRRAPPDRAQKSLLRRATPC